MLDHDVINRLIDAEDAGELLARIDTIASDEMDAISRLRHASVRGDLEAVRSGAVGICTRAEIMGMRRLANRLVELERVATMDAIGQAHLHSQTLTRLIDEEIAEDFQALKDAIAEATASEQA